MKTIGNDITEQKRVEEALHRSEERWQLAATGATDGIWDWDVAGHTVFLSARWKQVHGYREEEIGVDETEWSSRIHPEDSPGVMATLQSYFNKEIPAFHCEYRTRHKDGTYIWIIDRGIAVWDAQGRVVRMVGSETDITERKQREHALSEQRRLYKTVTDNAALALFIMDNSQQCVFMNPAAEALTGFTLAEVSGRPLHDVVHHTRPDGSHYPLSECPIDRALPKNDREQGEEVFVHKDGHFYSVAFTASPIRHELGQPIGTVIEVQDITERKRAELALQQNQLVLEEKRQELQVLTEKLFTAQESERQRIARELHDDFSQRLAALAIDLRTVRLEPSDSMPWGDARLSQLGVRAEQLATDLQQLSHRLHPSILEHIGLEAAVKEHVDEFASRTGLPIEVMAREVPEDVPLEQALCLYRVLQESLQNVRKHAHATTVLVRLLRTGRGLGLCVHDDGQGFENAQGGEGQRGLGLTSMEERVKAHHGTFRIRTKPGDGTEVHAWVPLDEGNCEGDA